MDELPAQWPLLVRAINMTVGPRDNSETPADPGAAVAIRLCDAKGRIHSLRLSTAAAVTLCVFLSNYTEAKLTLAEMMETRPFRMDQFAPALELMVEPNRAEDRGKLLAALSALAIDHPNFCFTAAAGDGNTNIGAIDELQLREIVDAVRRDHGVEIAIGKPQTAYRERITRHAEIDYTHKEQIGGQGEYARVKLVLEPTPSDYGHTFMSIRVRGILSEDFIDAVERGVRSGLAAGVLAGFPAIGTRVLLVDAAFHETDSTALTFEIAARSAVREGLRQGEPQLLEPIMRVNIATPQDCLGGILDDLKTRHGATDGRARRSRSGAVLTALVPAAKLFAYADSLKAMTGGRATFSTQFDRYAQIPSHDDPSFRPAAAARA